SKGIRITKGLSIKIKGSPKNQIENLPLASTYAFNLNDFHLHVPKLILREGDSVKRGTPIFYAKSNEKLKFVSPVSGTVKEIVRGERRKIYNIIIGSDGKDNFVKHKPPLLDSSSTQELIDFLLEAGVWPLINQRPFDIIADPNQSPKAIHVSCFDSSPLAVDYEFMMKDKLSEIKAGLNCLNKIVNGELYLGLKSCQELFQKEFLNYKINLFDGPHPSGNVGVQIHHINPINSGEVVWTLKLEDLAVIGKLISTGEYLPNRTIAVTGPPVKNPKYFYLRTGANIDSVINKVEIDNKSDVRFINGDVLSGHKVDSKGYIGHYNNKLSVLKEGNQYRLFGWIPFINNTVPSIYKTSFSWLFRNKEKDYDTNLNGEERAFVATGEMESVFPMDIYPMQLLKECMIGDIEKMEKLGIYEVSPEDFGLIDYSSSSKIEAQTIIRQGLDYIYKETQ
ncbi:MAG: Na(+)-translocating NADH-quinone reductase subunit A, partial [Bacteroidota bacterium]|nr:Na(+)-translocating NADH-quinone reductase subunit A [Bacteroidota bacterium]